MLVRNLQVMLPQAHEERCFVKRVDMYRLRRALV
jgi:hypothetical protein